MTNRFNVGLNGFGAFDEPPVGNSFMGATAETDELHINNIRSEDIAKEGEKIINSVASNVGESSPTRSYGR